MGKLAIQDIAKVLSDRKGLTKKEASNFANEMFDIIQEALERDMVVKVKGLGTFKIIDVDPRESVNVNTGERVLIEGHNKITFTPDQLLKEIVNKPFSQFETVVLNDGVDFASEAAAGAYFTPELANTRPLVDFVVEDPSFEKPIELGESAVAETAVPEDTVLEPEEKTPDPESVSELEPASAPEPAFEPENPTTEYVSELEPVEEPVSESEPNVSESEPNVSDPESDVSEPESGVPEAEDVTLPEPDETPAPDQEEAPVSEPVGTTEQEISEETAEAVYDDEEPSSGRGKWLMTAMALLLGLGAGYLLGNYFPIKGEQPVEAPVPPVEQPKVVVEDTLTVDSVVTPVASPDSVSSSTEAKAAEVSEADVAKLGEPETAETKLSEPKPAATKPVATKPTELKPAETKPAAIDEAAPDKYAAMDARVRTGAYRIVGTDRVVKVKEGDNLRKISQRALGPDMECYVEVYNGLKASSPLKVGQEIKIPKLQWKKKKKAQTAN